MGNLGLSDFCTLVGGRDHSCEFTGVSIKTRFPSLPSFTHQGIVEGSSPCLPKEVRAVACACPRVLFGS